VAAGKVRAAHLRLPVQQKFDNRCTVHATAKRPHQHRQRHASRLPSIEEARQQCVGRRAREIARRGFPQATGALVLT